MIVKICGIQTVETAEVAMQAGADLLGFVFAPSKRRLSIEQAAEIIHSLPTSVRKVGVFVNETVENMTMIAEEVGLDLIQLHGDEPPEVAEQLAYPVIKAYSIDQVEAGVIQAFPADYFLIDSPVGKYRGGTGETFNWDLLVESKLDLNKIILAGGLTPENIQTAIKKVSPIGVDVSSGVETNGDKDFEKIKQFIANAKG